MVLGILWFNWFKFTCRLYPCIWKCGLSSRLPQVITEAQELTKCETDLQMVQKDSEWRPVGTLREASAGYVPESNMLPTIFV